MQGEKMRSLLSDKELIQLVLDSDPGNVPRFVSDADFQVTVTEGESTLNATAGKLIKVFIGIGDLDGSLVRFYKIETFIELLLGDFVIAIFLHKEKTI